MPSPVTVGSLSVGTSVAGVGSQVSHQIPAVPVAFTDRSCFLSVFEFLSSTGLQVTGNGTTDDSAAIQAALTALYGSGLTLYFPAGTYLCTANAIVNPGVPVIMGPGAALTGTYAQAVAQGGGAPYYARAVMTTVATSTTYTGSGTNQITFGSNAAFGTQDGVTTLAVGDCVIMPGGTLGSCAITAKDAGPWLITSLGGASAKAVLTRPSWWVTGAVLPTLSQIAVGPEGTQFGGSKWSTWAVAGQVIGTNDPVLYPDHVMVPVTLASGFVTVTTIPIRSTTLTGFAYLSTDFSGGSTTIKFTTGAISSGGAATAAGGVGTGSVSITAITAAGVVVSGDASTGWLHVWNRP